MPKNLIEDIVSKKKTIRQVAVTNRRKIEKSVLVEEKKENPIQEEKNCENETNFEDAYEEARSRINRDYFKNSKENFNPRVIIWGIAVFCFLILIFTVFSSLSSATVTIHPKVVAVNLDDVYTLSKNPVAGELGFETLTVEKNITRDITATEEVKVEQKAEGTIIVYNNYSTAPQRLIKNTRFTGNNNLIYRIPDMIVVPGKKTVGGKTIPGSVETRVIADQPGESYNLTMSSLTGDFKIPGFMGSPRYQTFYGRLNTDITGGMVGMTKKITPEVEKKAVEDMQAELKKNILSEVTASKPETHIMLQGGLFWSFASTTSSSSKLDTKVTISQKATLNAILLNSQKLARYVAERKIDSYNNKLVNLAWDDKNSLSMEVKTDSLKSKPWDSESLPVHFSGDIKIVWQLDTKKIAEAVAGLSKNAILAKITPIIDATKVDISIRPAFWNNTLPSSPSKIHIETSID
jgi:hypothetical protein